jgi:hypothetical protein
LIAFLVSRRILIIGYMPGWRELTDLVICGIPIRWALVAARASVVYNVLITSTGLIPCAVLKSIVARRWEITINAIIGERSQTAKFTRGTILTRC